MIAIPLVLAAAGIGVLIMTNDASASNSAPVKDNKPSQWDDLFKKYGNENSVDWRVLKTIAMNESSLGTNSRVVAGLYNPYDIKASTSSDGLSWGIMQMTVPTARDFDPNADEVKLNNAEYSIKLASKFVRSLYKQFSNTDDVVMAYNHGAGNQRKFIAAGRPSNSYLAGQQYLAKYKKNYALIFG